MSDEYGWRVSDTEGEQSRTGRAAQRVRDAARQTGTALRGSLYAVCLTAIILLEILRRFVDGGLNREFSWSIVFGGLVTSLTTLLTFYVFFPAGKGAGAARAAHRDALKLMSDAVEKINSGLKTAFRAYCRELGEQEAEERRQAAFDALANCYVTKEEFEQKWKTATRKKLKNAVKKGELTKQAVKCIRVCRGAFAPTSYNPGFFLAGISADKQRKILRRGNRYETSVLVKKPISVVLVAVAQSAFVIGFHGVENGFEVFMAIVMSVFQICLSAFSGYLAGIGVAEHETEANLLKAGFMMDFLECRVQSEE